MKSILNKKKIIILEILNSIKSDWSLAENLIFVVENWIEDENFYDWLLEIFKKLLDNINNREWREKINESLVSILISKEIEKEEYDKEKEELLLLNIL